MDMRFSQKQATNICYRLEQVAGLGAKNHTPSRIVVCTFYDQFNTGRRMLVLKYWANKHRNCVVALNASDAVRVKNAERAVDEIAKKFKAGNQFEGEGLIRWMHLKKVTQDTIEM
ncbi:hypothetical protein J6590_054208 [Homalodisca vitripennis]|nr:hypothetical protein J6590_054208 [Homalodisca vitripennis]